MPKPPRISAVGDWGPAIFEEINNSLQDSKSIAVPLEADEPRKKSHANPHLSDSSSIYSDVHVASRRTSKMTPSDGRPIPQVLGPEIADANGKFAPAGDGRRRGSDTSSNQPLSQPPSRDGSRAGSGTNSHRHTKEIGDFYDSYWRQSRDVPGAGNSRQSRENSQFPGHSDEMGRSVTYGPVNGRGEMGKERRPGQLEVKVATIAEVPTPLTSPMRSPMSIGKAL